MKRHIFSKFQGTSVVLTVLIAVMLGMTNPSTVLGAKPLTEYAVVVLVECSDLTYQVDVTVNFYQGQKDGSERDSGVATPSCDNLQGARDADSMVPVWVKPNEWKVWVRFRDPITGIIYCENTYPDTGTSFPATLPYTCNSHTATVTIGTPRVFP